MHWGTGSLPAIYQYRIHAQVIFWYFMPCNTFMSHSSSCFSRVWLASYVMLTYRSITGNGVFWSQQKIPRMDCRRNYYLSLAWESSPNEQMSIYLLITDIFQQKQQTSVSQSWLTDSKSLWRDLRITQIVHSQLLGIYVLPCWAMHVFPIPWLWGGGAGYAGYDYVYTLCF